jgi:hypothetical protein
VAITVDRVKILRAAEGEAAAAWRDALGRGEWVAASRTLKEDPEGGSWVRRAEILGRDVVVKCRALNTLSRRVKHAMGMGHAHKQWRGAELLRKARLATARNWAIARARIDGRACEMLIAEFLEGPTLLECMRDASVGRLSIKDQHAVARAVGLQMSGMGWNFNRDHKPSNLIVMVMGSGSPEIAVIDCVGVRFKQVPKTERMLASLVIEPMGCGVMPRRALMMRALRAQHEELEKWYDPNDELDEGPEPVLTCRERIRMLVRMEWFGARAIVESHGDPRPRVDPLAAARESSR